MGSLYPGHAVNIGFCHSRHNQLKEWQGVTGCDVVSAMKGNHVAGKFSALFEGKRRLPGGPNHISIDLMVEAVL